MARYFIRRVLFFAIVLFAISVASFLITFKLGPIRFVACHTSTTCYSPQWYRNVLGFNGPTWVQYLRYAKGFVPWPGWFLNRHTYYSYFDFVSVRSEIASRVTITGALLLGAATLSFLIGVPAGVASSARGPSRMSRLLALAGSSIPVFLMAVVLQNVFALRLHALPAGGLPRAGHITITWAVLHGYFVLPWLALAMPMTAAYARRLQAELGRTLEEQSITARAGGLKERLILRRGLRTAIGPMVISFGFDLWLLVGGAIVVESAFNLPGIGQYAVRSLFTNDLPAVMGVTAAVSMAIVGANLVLDLVHASLDPRLRYA